MPGFGTLVNSHDLIPKNRAVVNSFPIATVSSLYLSSIRLRIINVGRHFWCLNVGSSWMYPFICLLMRTDRSTLDSVDGLARKFSRKVEHTWLMAIQTVLPRRRCFLVLSSIFRLTEAANPESRSNFSLLSY